MWRTLFYLLVAGPLSWLWFAFRVEGDEVLKSRGPTLIVANHNSHLDTVMLTLALPWARRGRVYAAAAADTFFRHPIIAALSETLFGAIPLERKSERSVSERLAPVVRRLKRGHTVIVYPEGTRGDPDVAQRFRRGGIAHLVAAVPELRVVPAYIDGAARAMPRGSVIPLPFTICVRVGTPLTALLPDQASAVLERRVRALAPDEVQFA